MNSPRTLWQTLLAGVDVAPALPKIAAFDSAELAEFHAEAMKVLRSLDAGTGTLPREDVQRWIETVRVLALASVPQMGPRAGRARADVERAYAAALDQLNARRGPGAAARAPGPTPAPTPAPARGARLEPVPAGEGDTLARKRPGLTLLGRVDLRSFFDQ